MPLTQTSSYSDVLQPNSAQSHVLYGVAIAIELLTASHGVRCRDCNCDFELREASVVAIVTAIANSVASLLTTGYDVAEKQAVLVIATSTVIVRRVVGCRRNGWRSERIEAATATVNAMVIAIGTLSANARVRCLHKISWNPSVLCKAMPWLPAAMDGHAQATFLCCCNHHPDALAAWRHQASFCTAEVGWSALWPAVPAVVSTEVIGGKP